MQTVVLKLRLRMLNRAKEERLCVLAELFTACVRFHWENIKALQTTNTTVIHRACYQEAREQFALPASTIQQARDKAVAAYRSYINRRKRDRRVRPPAFRKPLPLRLAVENLRVFAEQAVVRVSTPDGYLWLPVIVPECFQEVFRRPHAVSEIVHKRDGWYLMLAVKHEDVPVSDDELQHFGLDLGLANLAVLSGPGIVRFFDGKPLRFVRGKFFRYRQALQRKRKISMVKRSKGKEARWATNENHRVSREIINSVAAVSGVLHVERLTGIRERCKGTKKINRMIAGWPFAQLLSFLKYKAALAGVRVIDEDPRHTSQRCSRCGHTDRKNRPKQAEFHCQQCGYQIHADLNASRNLAAKGACSLGVPGVTPGESSD